MVTLAVTGELEGVGVLGVVAVVEVVVVPLAGEVAVQAVVTEVAEMAVLLAVAEMAWTPVWQENLCSSFQVTVGNAPQCRHHIYLLKKTN